MSLTVAGTFVVAMAFWVPARIGTGPVLGPLSQASAMSVPVTLTVKSAVHGLEELNAGGNSQVIVDDPAPAATSIDPPDWLGEGVGVTVGVGVGVMVGVGVGVGVTVGVGVGVGVGVTVGVGVGVGGRTAAARSVTDCEIVVACGLCQ